MGKLPLWIDCDPGHDDAIAILLGSNLPYFNLVGISTVHGNAPLSHTTENALSLLEAFHIDPSVDVYPGADKPIKRPLEVAPSIHGESGLDGTKLLPKPVKKPVFYKPNGERYIGELSSIGDGSPDKPNVPRFNSAAYALAEAVKKYPGELLVVATGTLTNIADFIAQSPELVPKIKALSIMGGGFKLGNWTKFAEFNIWCDPEAAQTVLASDKELSKKTFLVPLDMTHQAIATKEIIEQVLNEKKSEGKDTSKSENTPLDGKRHYVRRMLYELLLFFAHTYETTFGDQFKLGPPVHDPLAVAALIPSFVAPVFPNVPELNMVVSKYKLDVVLEGERVGQTVEVAKDNEYGVQVVEGMNIDSFWQIVLESLNNLDAKA